MAESKLILELGAARRAGVPLLAIESADPASCIKQVRLALQGKAPLVSWDRSDGFKPQNIQGESVLRSILGQEVDGAYPIVEFDKAFRSAGKFPKDTIVFVLNGNKFVEPSMFPDQALNTQALWNLRDEYKKDKRMIILLCPSITLPSELKHDVIVLEDPLPGTDELKVTIKSIYKAALVAEPKDDTIDRAVESVRGLSSFAVEQVAAMSMEKTGLNLERLWIKKQKTIEMTPGLRIWKGKETFNDVRGIEQLKRFIHLVMNGEDKPTVGVFWDELEKAFAGTQGDLSGVSQEMHGQILSWMADFNVPAIRYVGHPGCSKSYISKAMAGEFKIPLIVMNISELKGSLVGESTQNLKNALKVISAVGRPIVMATCNNEEALSPELRDRFNLGVWMFDLPTKDEQHAVFEIWKSKYDIKSALPDDYDGWTQRNIHDCCSLAWRLKCSLNDASKFIVPVIRSAPERIESLRKKAHGKYLSASNEGVYKYKDSKFSNDTIRSIDVSPKIGEA